MYNKINQWLNYPHYFRYGFWILFLISLLLNGFIFPNENNFFILYIIVVIFLGIGFYNKSRLFLVFFTTVVVLFRFLLIQALTENFISFFVLLFTYMLITFISAGLMDNFQKVQLDNLELTKALANALDSRDPYTLDHSVSVAKYSVAIAEKMHLPKKMLKIIHIGGLMHDIGKIGLPEHVLTKPGKLTDEEYALIKTHPTLGYEIIKHVASFKDSGILDIVLYHHERYDGKGYPTGIKGEDIPLAARIVAIADTFDAMTSKRVYRDKLDLDFTLNEIRKNKGAQFDPEITDVFLSLFDKKS